MITKINHLGIAVQSLAQTEKQWKEVLGLQKLGEEEVAAQKVKVAMFKVGESKVELLEATSPESAIAKFLDKRGEGIQHICFQVDDIKQALAEMKAKGAPVIDAEPRIGAGGHKVAFLHPKGFNGVLIELLEE
jgi:methylmalonyl-CoA/ethylmalonyl-CoA epimerase